MMTSRQRISRNGEEESTSFQEVFHASHFQSPDEERERMMTVTSGRRCFGRYGRYSPLGSLVRTLLESSRWYSPAVRLRWEAKPLYSERVTQKLRCSSSTSSKPSARTLNVRDIQSSRLLFRLVPSVHRTAGTGCGLLPSVQTQGLKRCNAKGSAEFFPLELLPTPTATDSGSGRVNRSLGENAKDRPTIALAAKMGLLPTPTVSCQKEGCPKERKDGTPRTSELNHLFASRTGAVSQLNPLFVSDMMGFPIMWCDI